MPAGRPTGGTLPSGSHGSGAEACQTPPMITGGRRQRRRGLAGGLAVLAGASMITACEPLDDPQPTVASVNFEPRLVVTVGPEGVVAEAGERDGARLDGTDGATVPKGSVVEVRNAGDDGRQVVITLALLDSTDPADAEVWLDTGTMEPGETTVLGLSAVGTYRFRSTSTDSGTSELTLHVVA